MTAADDERLPAAVAFADQASLPGRCEHGLTRAHRRRIAPGQTVACPGPGAQQSPTGAQLDLTPLGLMAEIALLTTAQTRSVPCRRRPDAWFSVDDDERTGAAEQCTMCPLLAPCAAAGRGERHGVWGGVDRTWSKRSRGSHG